MSTKAQIRTLHAGERADVSNDTGKPLQVVFRTGTGTSLSTTLPVGASMQINMGRDSGKLFLLEPETEPQRLRIVRSQ